MNEILEKAYQDSVEAYEEYMKAERALAMESGGFIPKEVLDRVARAKIKWQTKHNDFYTLLSKQDQFGPK